MPDYGTRMPPYTKGILGKAPYGWSGTPPSNINNTPSNQYFPDKQFVYERMDWDAFKKQIADQGMGTQFGMKPLVGYPAAGYWSNPPFMGAGQMLGPDGAPSWMRDQNGGTTRILRGYLRRNFVTGTDPASYVRLYFMYNPDQVERTYQSLSDSAVLDPTAQQGVETDASIASQPFVATIYFTLYFDRQIEVATVQDHPGVMVDLQTMDVLAGQLIFGDTTGGGDTTVLPPGMSLPDNTDTTANHAGQLQPINTAMPVTAVFSPSLAVEGIISGMSARFTKFSTRMTPTTLALSLNLMVSYVGKNNNQSLANADVGAGVVPNAGGFDPNATGFTTPASQVARNTQTKTGASAAVDYAMNYLMDSQGVFYDPTMTRRNDGPPCNTRTPAMTDCSSFVWRAFQAIGWADLLNFGVKCGSNAPASDGFVSTINANSSGANRKWYIYRTLPQNTSTDDAVATFNQMRKGDVLVRKPVGDRRGHVAFWYGTTGTLNKDNWEKNYIQLVASAGSDVKAANGVPAHKLGGSMSNTSMYYIAQNYHILARPEPWGPTTDISVAGTVTS
jgi:hypothetical protein